jgi:hypothetical protein
MGEQAARKRERRAEQARRTPARPATPRATATTTGQSHRVVAALLATVVVVGLAAAGFLVWLSRQSDSAVAAPGPRSVHPAATDRAVYRVDDTAGPQPREQTDVVSVRRPGEVRVEHHDGPPPGGRIFSGIIVNRSDQTFLPDRNKTFATPLTAVLDPDVLSEPALAAAADSGRVARLGLASVLGQQCTRYLYHHSGGEALSRGDDQEKVEVCVTSDDIMLRQAVTLAGRVVRLAEVVQLDRSPSFAPDVFASGPGETSAGAQVTEKVVEGRPTDAGATVAGEAPQGFHLDRRLTDSHQEIDTPLLPFYIESYVRGSEFVISQQLLVTSGAGRPWQSTGGAPVTLAGGQTGQILYHTGYVEVQTTVSGYPVRVVASSAELASYFAGTLRASG